jgi:hypothetical protein
MELGFVELGVFDEGHHSIIVLTENLDHVQDETCEIVGFLAWGELDIQDLLDHFMVLHRIWFNTYETILVYMFFDPGLVVF